MKQLSCSRKFSSVDHTKTSPSLPSPPISHCGTVTASNCRDPPQARHNLQATQETIKSLKRTSSSFPLGPPKMLGRGGTDFALLIYAVEISRAIGNRPFGSVCPVAVEPRTQENREREKGEGRTCIRETPAETAFVPRTFPAPPLPCIRQRRRLAAPHTCTQRSPNSDFQTQKNSFFSPAGY